MEKEQNSPEFMYINGVTKVRLNNSLNKITSKGGSHSRLLAMVIHSNPVMTIPTVIRQACEYESIAESVSESCRDLTSFDFDVLMCMFILFNGSFYLETVE